MPGSEDVPKMKFSTRRNFSKVKPHECMGHTFVQYLSIEVCAFCLATQPLGPPRDSPDIVREFNTPPSWLLDTFVLPPYYSRNRRRGFLHE